MALITSLVSYWKMDEVSGNREDIHSTNDLTDTNTVASATGKISNGADFEKTNSEVLTITDASQSGLDITGAFSFNCWLTLESSTGSNNTIVSKYTVANGKGYQIYIGTANNIVGDFTAADGSLSSGATNNAVIPDDGTFRMITVTFTPSGSDRVKVYLNASAQAIPSPTDSAWDIAATADPFCIGSRNGSAFYDGIIDECGIWSKVLSQAEIDQLYNSGSGLAYPFVNTYTVALDQGSFALTGIAALLTSARSLVMATGAFALTGIATVFNRGYMFAVDVGSFVLTGFDIVVGFLWERPSKSSSTWVDESSNASTWVNEDPAASSWTNENKT